MFVKKKGVSPVIATVLLLVLTLVAISILSVFVIPFVKNSLEGSKECVDVLGGIRFDEASRYNCRNLEGAVGRSAFSVRIDHDEIIAFQATLFKQGSGDPYTIENNKPLVNIRMLNQTAFNVNLNVPDNGGTRTYVVNDYYDRIEINPILRNGELCEAQETIRLSDCTDATVVTQIRTP